MIGMGEELDGFDVGDRIDHLPRHHRARPCPRFRMFADPWHEVADQEDIADHPKHQPRSDAPIHRAKQHHRADKRCGGEEHRMQHLGHDIGQRAAGLHFLL